VLHPRTKQVMGPEPRAQTGLTRPWPRVEVAWKQHYSQLQPLPCIGPNAQSAPPYAQTILADHLTVETEVGKERALA